MTKTLKEVKNEMAKAFGHGLTREEAYDQKKCVCCGGEARSFRDALSRKEYNISIFCQGCQDKTYGR